MAAFPDFLIGPTRSGLDWINRTFGLPAAIAAFLLAVVIFFWYRVLKKSGFLVSVSDLTTKKPYVMWPVIVATAIAPLAAAFYLAAGHEPYVVRKVVWLAGKSPLSFVVRARAIDAGNGRPAGGVGLQARVLATGTGAELVQGTEYTDAKGFTYVSLRLPEPVADRSGLSLEVSYDHFGFRKSCYSRSGGPVIFKFDDVSKKPITAGFKISLAGTCVSESCISDDCGVWALLRDEAGNYYLQQDVILDDGRWMAPRVICGSGVTGAQIVWADPDGHRWFVRRAEENKWGGFRLLPDNVVTLAATKLNVVEPSVPTSAQPVKVSRRT